MDKIKIDKDNIVISIHQPGYHRYLGYFYKILISDLFISFDTVQYVSREFQNRQKFLFNNELKWLSVPVDSGRDVIKYKKIVDIKELQNHWRVIEQIYNRSDYFHLYKDEIGEFYHRNWTYLSDFCDEFSKMLMRLIGIDTTFVKASEYYNNKNNYKKGKLILETIKNTICIDSYKEIVYTPREYPIPNDHYLYNKSDSSKRKEIDILEDEYISVLSYIFQHPSYKQTFPNQKKFIPYLSIVDLLFNEGPSTLDILRSANPTEYKFKRKS